MEIDTGQDLANAEKWWRESPPEASLDPAP
jgi:hypothetical protein